MRCDEWVRKMRDMKITVMEARAEGWSLFNKQLSACKTCAPKMNELWN